MPLPSVYSDQYEQLLARIGTASGQRDQALSAFWPMEGRCYQHGKGLLVIGRAANGWEGEFRPSELIGTERRRELVAAARQVAEDKFDMSWVVEWAGNRHYYNTNRSAFWQVARGVFKLLDPTAAQNETQAWSNHLCWSNLCKIAPSAGRNPPGWAWNAQWQDCIDLLRIELETWNPAWVLVLAGQDWYRWFVQPLGVEVRPTGANLVEAVGRLGNQRWILAKHPERKPQRPMVEQAAYAIQALLS